MPSSRKLPRETRELYVANPKIFLRNLRVPGARSGKLFADVWADFQEEAFDKIIPCLQAVSRNEPSPLKGAWLERTKGASKDSDVGCLLLWLQLFAERPLLIELGADKSEQAAETHKAMLSVARLNPWILGQLDFQQRKIICNRTNVVCQFLTATDTAAHGSRPNLTVCNELSHITKRQFAETMLDNADKLADNFMIVATNAGDLHTWQYDWRETFRTDPAWWFQKVDQPAPWIPERNIANAKKRNSTTRFNRLWRGVWSPREGDAIDPADIDAAMRLPGPMTPEQVKQEGLLCILAADAGVKHDHAALVNLGVKFGDPMIRLVRCESWAPGPDKRIDLTLMEAAILRAHKEFPVIGLCYDVTQMEFMAERIMKAGLLCDPIGFTAKEADEMARVLLHHFRNRYISLYPDELLRRDLGRLIIKEKIGTGHYRLDAVRDEYGHADRAIALAIGLPAAALVAGQMPTDEDEEGEHVIEV